MPTQFESYAAALDRGLSGKGEGGVSASRCTTPLSSFPSSRWLACSASHRLLQSPAVPSDTASFFFDASPASSLCETPDARWTATPAAARSARIPSMAFRLTSFELILKLPKCVGILRTSRHRSALDAGPHGNGGRSVGAAGAQKVPPPPPKLQAAARQTAKAAKAMQPRSIGL